MENFNDYNCPMDAALQLVGGKYKGIIIWLLADATLRYSEIRRAIPSATDKMLTKQLRELEQGGLLTRKVYPVVPPRTEYSLTDLGRSLSPILSELCAWGKRYLLDTAGSR